MKVFVTGESLEHQRDRLPETLRGEKLDWVSLPVLDFRRLPVPADILKRTVLNPFGWIVFSSPRSVEFWSESMIESQIDFPLETQVACMGEGTAAAAEFDGFTPDFFPTEPGTEGFLAEFEALVANNLDKPSILLPAAEQGRTLLREKLSELGCEVVWFPLYRTQVKKDIGHLLAQLEEGDSRVIVFTSPSSVDAIMAHSPLKAGTEVVAIGEYTADRLRSLGMAPKILPSSDLQRVTEVL